jgi:hypothetical protein
MMKFKDWLEIFHKDYSSYKKQYSSLEHFKVVTLFR